MHTSAYASEVQARWPDATLKDWYRAHPDTRRPVIRSVMMRPPPDTPAMDPDTYALSLVPYLRYALPGMDAGEVHILAGLVALAMAQALRDPQRYWQLLSGTDDAGNT